MTKYDEQLKRCLSYISSGTEEDPMVMVLKGGPYKIKGYYLENNDLDDIRGASANLDYVGSEVIPGVIRKYCEKRFDKHFDESCIIYNGGGNIFCILPPDIEWDFAHMLEEEAQKYLVSANTAYVLGKTRYSDIRKSYAKVMARIEEMLNERKNMKIAIDFKPESVFFKTGIPWRDGGVVELNAKEFDGNEVCCVCKTRLAGYELIPEGTMVCGSCLHKKRIGEHIKNTTKSCDSLSDIDKDYVALIYGDGNNMGQHIQEVKNITDMMEFSDTVKSVTSDIMHETMEKLDIQKFDIVGAGGDDVFVIISGKKAMKFTDELMDKFHTRLSPTFEQVAYENVDKNFTSMSFGVCIAKPDTPIRVMLETAWELLEIAKDSSKHSYGTIGDKGQRAFAVLDGQTNLMNNKKNNFGAMSTCQSYSEEEESFFARTVASIPKAGKTAAVRKMYNTYCNADTAEEAYLAFQYQNAKEPVAECRISLPNDDLWMSHEKGIYKTWEGEGFMWKDILDWIVFSDEEEQEE